MEKLKKFIVNLKVAGKLKAYRVMVLTMTCLLYTSDAADD